MEANTVLSVPPYVVAKVPHSRRPPHSTAPAGQQQQQPLPPPLQRIAAPSEQTPPVHKHRLLSPVLDRIRSTRFRSKSTSESPSSTDVAGNSTSDKQAASSGKGILKRLLLKRHKAKQHLATGSKSLDDTNTSRSTAVAPPSIGLLEGILPPDSEYYVTVSGGDRSKLLTFHPKVDNTSPNTPSYPRLSTFFENVPSGGAGEATDVNYNSSDVLCAKIVASQLAIPRDSDGTDANERLDTMSKSKYFVSALNSERDISNFSHVPIAGRGLPGLTRFIYKAPPRGAAVDIGVNEEILKVFDDQEIYIQFMKSHTCYHILAKSSKLIVFDSELKIKRAFQALLYNAVCAAVIWNSSKKQYDGMITVTDFIMRMRAYINLDSPKMIEEFESDTISSWRSRLKKSIRPLVSVAPTDSLYEAAKRLSESNVHRVLVIDPISGDAMSVITHKRLLRFLYLYIHELARPSYLSMQIGELRIGTFDKIYTVTPEDSIHRALDIFVEHDVSAVPVVNGSSGVLVDVYSKFDVIFLIKCQQTFTQPRVADGLAVRERVEDYRTFTMEDTLLTVIERLVEAEAHRLICVDDDGKVQGIISLSDILCFLVLHAPRHMKDRSLQANQS